MEAEMVLEERAGSYESDRLFAEIEVVLKELCKGNFVVVMDNEDRENEGDLIMAANLVTPMAINFMATYARGLICAAITSERAEELKLEPMVDKNECPHGTAFTVSVDAGPDFGVTTGISAYDRAKTIELLVTGKASDLRRPGHIFPLVARPGGVLEREGHTEAAVDLALLAGLPPAGVIVEIMNDDGSMARRDQLENFARLHGLCITTVNKIKRFRELNSSSFNKTARETEVAAL